MPTDTASRTVLVAAPLDRVLETVRAVDTQPEWVKEILEAEVLDKDDLGRPTRARFRAATPVGSDRYTLAYDHSATGMSWHLLEGRLQTGQDGRYTLQRKGARSTEVTFELTVTHNLPLPGFVRRRVINGLVVSTTDGLKSYLE
jgi:uncharacterized membrane protein